MVIFFILIGGYVLILNKLKRMEKQNEELQREIYPENFPEEKLKLDIRKIIKEELTNK